LFNVIGPAAESCATFAPIEIDVEAKFRAERDLASGDFKGLADELLIDKWTIRVAVSKSVTPRSMAVRMIDEFLDFFCVASALYCNVDCRWLSISLIEATAPHVRRLPRGRA
jgi:hypothetical protein